MRSMLIGGYLRFNATSWDLLTRLWLKDVSIYNGNTDFSNHAMLFLIEEI